MTGMTKLLEEAVAKIRELPDADQNEAADMMLAVAAKSAAPIDAATRSAILEGVSQALRGEFVPDEEIAELWSRHGV